MADDEDGEEEALVMWVVDDGNSEGNKNMAWSKQKNEGRSKVWGQKITFITDISYALSNKSELCVHLYLPKVTEIKKKISP
jgi:hypothetical protein